MGLEKPSAVGNHWGELPTFTELGSWEKVTCTDGGEPTSTGISTLSSSSTPPPHSFSYTQLSLSSFSIPRSLSIPHSLSITPSLSHPSARPPFPALSHLVSPRAQSPQGGRQHRTCAGARWGQGNNIREMDPGKQGTQQEFKKPAPLFGCKELIL